MASFTFGNAIEVVPSTGAPDPFGRFEPVQLSSTTIVGMDHVTPTVDAGAPFSVTASAAFVPPASVAFTFGNALEVPQTAGTFDWFDSFHVMPRSIAQGNVTSDVTMAVSVFSAHRRGPSEWTSFVSNAGTGVTLANQPALPTNVTSFNSIANLQLQIDDEGDAFVNATLDFTFGSDVIIVPITLQRLTLWIGRAEQVHRERLSWLTRVYLARSGKEKREKRRKSPRLSYFYPFLYEDSDADRHYLENTLFNRQGRDLAVPIYRHGAVLTAAATSGVTSTLSVESTAFRDFRVGQEAVLFQGSDTRRFDAQTIQSVTATTIVLAAAVERDFSVGEMVYPVQVVRMPRRFGGLRWVNGLWRADVQMTVKDNDLDIADASAFPSYDGKPLLEVNVMRGLQKREAHHSDVTLVDGRTGITAQQSLWASNRRSFTFTLRTFGRQEEWEARQLLYFLGGMQKSFYIARSSDDLVPLADIQDATTTIRVKNVGYSQFVNAAQNKADIRVTKSDDTTLTRVITSATQVDEDEEELTITVPWSETITVANVKRIEYIEKVRLDSDNIEIQHSEDFQRSYFELPYRTVLE